MVTIENVVRLGRVKRVSCLMMQDRNYKIGKKEEEILNLEDIQIGAFFLKEAIDKKISFAESFSASYSENITGTEKDAKEGQKCAVIFIDINFDEGKKKEKMVSTEQAKGALLHWKTNFADCQNCIFITPGKLSPDAKKEVHHVAKLSLLSHEYLSFPKGRHVMVPKHQALEEEDARVFLSARKLTREQLPQLKLSDPISMYYGFQLGTIVKIQRASWTVFRIVSD